MPTNEYEVSAPGEARAEARGSATRRNPKAQDKLRSMKLSREQIIGLIKSGKSVVRKHEGEDRYRDVSLHYAAKMEDGATFRAAETQHEIILFIP